MTTTARYDETTDIRDWRWQQLWEADIDSRLCDYFAPKTEVDLNKVLVAKANGCSDDMLLRIFA